MSTHNIASAPRRDAFRCTGEQLEALIRFAVEMGLENQPLHSVVLAWHHHHHITV